MPELFPLFSRESLPNIVNSMATVCKRILVFIHHWLSNEAIFAIALLCILMGRTVLAEYRGDLRYVAFAVVLISLCLRKSITATAQGGDIEDPSNSVKVAWRIFCWVVIIAELMMLWAT